MAGSFVKARSIAYLFGTQSTLAMNVTPQCPATNINPSLGNQTWSQFVGSFMGVKFSEAPGQYLDGVFLDNYVDRPLELPNNLPAIYDVQIGAGGINFRTRSQAGELQAADQAAAPGLPLSAARPAPHRT